MPSPTFPMMSPCLTGVGDRTYRFDLDIVANSPRSSHSSSSASSTLSESSNNSTPLFISTKRNRTPRKRPNQCSAEASALLSSIYPKLFSATNLKRPTTFHLQLPLDDPFPVLLPSFPISNDASLLLQNLPSSPKSPSIHPNPTKPHNTIIIHSPKDFHYQDPDPGSPDLDAQSILDEEVEEGIDSILGNLSMSKDSSSANCLNSNSIIDPCLASLMGFGLSGGFGFRFGVSSEINIRGALRQSNDGEWWRSPTVAVKDIVPTLGVMMEEGKLGGMADNNNNNKKKKKKKKKKVEKEEAVERKVSAAVSLSGDGSLKKQQLLGLKLNYDGVLKEWSGGSPFSGETGSPDSAAEVVVSLTDIDLFLDIRDGAMREASVQRYKEKRRNRLFSKKIRYEVRKTNANQRPRMKGRFVRGPSLLQEAMAEER